MFEIQSTVCVPLYAAACIFSTPFSTAVYIAVRLVLQTNYVLNKEIPQFLGLKPAVYNRERVTLERVRYLQQIILGYLKSRETCRKCF